MRDLGKWVRRLMVVLIVVFPSVGWAERLFCTQGMERPPDFRAVAYEQLFSYGWAVSYIVLGGLIALLLWILSESARVVFPH